MSSHFSGNQYENGFDPKKLRNWQIPQTYKERPSARDGFTQIIATDRGHLIQGASRSKDSPWGTFVGTWDMPQKIPGNVTTHMARSKPAVTEIERSQKDHETFMRQATGSPVKEQPSLEDRPGRPTPGNACPDDIPASKSPPQTSPKTPNPISPEEETTQAPSAAVEETE